MIYKPSKPVFPEFAYINAIPNKIKHELRPPNRKYINPPIVENSEFLFIVLNKYILNTIYIL